MSPVIDWIYDNLDILPFYNSTFMVETALVSNICGDGNKSQQIIDYILGLSMLPEHRYIVKAALDMTDESYSGEFTDIVGTGIWAHAKLTGGTMPDVRTGQGVDIPHAVLFASDFGRTVPSVKKPVVNSLYDIYNIGQFNDDAVLEAAWCLDILGKSISADPAINILSVDCTLENYHLYYIASMWMAT